MRIKKLGFISAIIALGAVLICSLVGAFAVMANANSLDFSFESELSNSYKVRDTLTVPKATIGDTQADFRIILPDGTVSNLESFTLSTPGSYTIEYTATVDGKFYKTAKTFVVAGDLFTIGGMGSAEYITIENSGVSGMNFTLYNGSSITYNDVIDLSKFNGPKDTLFKMIPLVSVVGEADITRFEVTLTDAYDENNFVNIRFKRSDQSHANDYTIAYLDANFNGGVYAGFVLNGCNWEGKNTNTNGYYVDGLNGIRTTVYKDETKKQAVKEIERTEGWCNTVYVNNARVGANIQCSFTGGTVSSPKNSGKQWAGVAFDYNTNMVYATQNSYRSFIADLENADIYGEKFHGFTNNMVKVTITPTIFSKGSCNLFVTEFAGQKITEENAQSFVSSYEPTIDIDLGDYSEDNIPYVAKGSSYAIFPATAYDILEGDIPVETSVYYGYHNAYKNQVQLVDGVFNASRAGVYTVVYKATNSVGKSTIKTLDIISTVNSDKLALNLSGEPDYTVSAPAGKTVKVLSSYEVINGYGNTGVSIVAKHKTDSSISFVLDEDNDYSFVPVTSGEYEILYTFFDYSATDTISRTLNVVASDNVYYVQAGPFPQYFILNGVYDLDVIKSYTLDTGVPVEKNSLLFVDVGTELIPVDDNVLEVLDDYVTAGNTIKLVYKPDVTIDESAYYTKELPVIDAKLYEEVMYVEEGEELYREGPDKSKYFVNTVGEFEFTMGDDDTKCLPKTFDNGKVAFDFANIVNANPFKIELTGAKKGETFVPFDRLNVYLYNTMNVEDYVLFSMANIDDGWYVSVNNQSPLKISSTWGGADDKFTISYQATQGKASLNTYFKYSQIKFFGTDTLATFDNGAYMSLELIGADGCDGVSIYTINDNVMDNLGDMAKSVIDTSRDFNAGDHKLGDTITLLPFRAYDLFSAYIKTTVEVTLKVGNEKKVVKDVNGAEMTKLSGKNSYQFMLSEYGEYTVTIKAEDSMDKSNNRTENIKLYVPDIVKPVVNITNKKLTYSVGSKFTIPKFTVDIPEYTFLCVIEKPDGCMDATDGKEGNEFKFETKGEYLVTLIVYDANMNITEVSYTVTVK